ncbi:cyclic nucleotide-binding domain-containing protein, partial [bacterium]|nr:cyclic nucleotide-binding domain-containing protein [bacterium]
YLNILHLWNLYFNIPNGDKKTLLKEYLRKKIIDFIILLVFINLKKENVNILNSFNSDIYYVISETILYFEELIQGKNIPNKRELITALNLLDLTFKMRRKNKYRDNKKGELSKTDKVFLHTINLEERISNDKESIFMKDIMDNLMLLKNVEMFNEISIFKLESLLMLSKKANFKKGDIMLKEGKQGENLYIIKSGKAEVTKKIGFIQTSVKKLEKGDWFGELSIISTKETSATVKALTNSEVLIIPASAFKMFIINNPELSFKIFEILVSYIKDSNMIGEAL